MSIRIDSNKVGGQLPLQQRDNQIATKQSQTEQAKKAPAAGVHQHSSYEKVGSVTFDDGTRIDLPDADGNAPRLRTLLSALSDVDRERLSAAGSQLGAQVERALASNDAFLPSGELNSDGLVNELGDDVVRTFETYVTVTAEENVHDAVNDVMMLAVEDIEGQLSSFATRVHDGLDAQKDLRSDIADIRDVITNWPEGAETQNVTWTEYGADGQVTEHVDVPLTQDQAKTLVDRLDGQLSSMRETSELDKLRLQDLYQRYNRVISTLSNILKVQHDTLKAIIGNLRA